jgi:glycogen debranching enzyme
MPIQARFNLRRFLFRTAVLFLAASLHAQTAPPPPPTFDSLNPIAFDTSGPVLRAVPTPGRPFTVAGERGILVGQQDGILESWILPVKLLSHLTLEASVEGYGVPIDVNQQAASIEVRPDRTVITYSHPAFTVRQIMFSPALGLAGAGLTDTALGHTGLAQTGFAQTGPIVLYEFDCLHPTLFTFRFTPELKWMWPERNEGAPGPEWVAPDANNLDAGEPDAHKPTAANGFYILHTDYPNLAAALTIPGAVPGILAPYQERPQIHPMELKLQIDPVRDRDKLFPLLMAAGITPSTATNAVLAATLAELNTQIPALYAAHEESWKNLLAHATSIETPDQTLNEAFKWAVISIEQLKTRTIAGQSSPPALGGMVIGPGYSAYPLDTALVAGYFTSADSARPGFGWFFGRDALYTLYAVNGYGDFALTKSELEFLIHRQRADGKIMHEYSQTAAAIDWQAFPYMYAAADSTPLFLLAVADYVRSSGDTGFLTEHRDAIEKAWAYETDPAHDTDHDGIYDNSQGTGWVESWPGGMPHQEIYLALLDQQASSAMASIEGRLGDSSKAKAAEHRAELIAKTINTEYADPEKGCYAFGRNLDGSNDRTTSIYPALAWWDPGPGQPILQKGEECLRHFAGSALNTDWGTRDVANTEKIYDGLSYHQGSVWPLFTGWAALAEYRGNQPLAGYQLLMENANLTRAQDLGAVTELLSGDFFVPFGRSTSHQLWSSSMVITPTLRGLFGISIDAQSKTITVNPHLPAQWGGAEVNNLPLPGVPETLIFARAGAILTVRIDSLKHAGWKLLSDLPGAENRENHLSSEGLMIAIPLPDIELKTPLFGAPAAGSRPRTPRIVSEEYGDRKLTLTVEGPADNSAHAESDGTTTFGHVFPVTLIRHKLVNPRLDLPVGVSGGPRLGSAFVSWREVDTAHHDPQVPIEMDFHFPSGTGFQAITVTLTW